MPISSDGFCHLVQLRMKHDLFNRREFLLLQKCRDLVIMRDASDRRERLAPEFYKNIIHVMVWMGHDEEMTTGGRELRRIEQSQDQKEPCMHGD